MVADKSIRVVMPHRRAMIPVSEVEKLAFPAPNTDENLKTGT
jgi:hypothetical protein